MRRDLRRYVRRTSEDSMTRSRADRENAEQNSVSYLLLPEDLYASNGDGHPFPEPFHPGARDFPEKKGYSSTESIRKQGSYVADSIRRHSPSVTAAPSSSRPPLRRQDGISCHESTPGVYLTNSRILWRKKPPVKGCMGPLQH